MAQGKRSMKDYLDALVDKQGLRTEVTVTLTRRTLIMSIGGLLLVGVGVVLTTHLMKNAFPNKQLAENNKLLADIKMSLKG